MTVPNMPTRTPAAYPASCPASHLAAYLAAMHQHPRRSWWRCRCCNAVALCVAPGFAPDATSRVLPWPRRGNEKPALESGAGRTGVLFSIAAGAASHSRPRLHPLARKTWASGFRAFGLAPVVCGSRRDKPPFPPPTPALRAGWGRLRTRFACPWSRATRSTARGLVAAQRTRRRRGTRGVPQAPDAALGPLRSPQGMGDEAAHALGDAAGRLGPPSLGGFCLRQKARPRGRVKLAPRPRPAPPDRLVVYSILVAGMTEHKRSITTPNLNRIMAVAIRYSSANACSRSGPAPSLRRSPARASGRARSTSRTAQGPAASQTPISW